MKGWKRKLISAMIGGAVLATVGGLAACATDGPISGSESTQEYWTLENVYDRAVFLGYDKELSALAELIQRGGGFTDDEIERWRYGYSNGIRIKEVYVNGQGEFVLVLDDNHQINLGAVQDMIQGGGNGLYDVGEYLPDFSVTEAEGYSVSLYDLLENNELVVLNFWATWCGPCKQEFPALHNAVSLYNDKVAVLALSTTDTLEDVAGFKSKNYYTLFHMATDENNIAKSFADYSDAIPFTVLLDPNGKILYKQTGTITDRSGWMELFEKYGVENGVIVPPELPEGDSSSSGEYPVDPEYPVEGELEYEFISETEGYEVIGIGSYTEEELEIPATYKGYPVTRIRDHAFAYNSRITSVYIHAGITEIYTGTFAECTSLREVYMESSPHLIEFNVFLNCTSLENIVVLQSGMYQSIDGVLYANGGIELIAYPAGKADTYYKLHENIVIVTENAFYGAQNLVTVEIPETAMILHLGMNAFMWSSVEELIMNGEAWRWNNFRLEVGIMAFYNSAIRKINVPIGMIEIDAFSSCENLESLIVHSDAWSFGGPFFNEGTSLQDIYYMGTEETWYNNRLYTLVENTGATVHYYSETNPENTTGNFWYLAWIDGAYVPKLWNWTQKY